MVISIIHTLPPLTLSTPAVDVSREISKPIKRRHPFVTFRRKSSVNDSVMNRVEREYVLEIVVVYPLIETVDVSFVCDVLRRKMVTNGIVVSVTSLYASTSVVHFDVFRL